MWCKSNMKVQWQTHVVLQGSVSTLLFFILYLLLIAATPKIVKGRYFKGYGTGIASRPRPQDVYRPECPAGAKISLRGSNLRSVTRQFPRIHMPQIRWTKHGHQCLWLPDVLLYHDIEFNPGLTEKRPKCVTCNTVVRRNQAAILCSNCASCFHAKCSGLSKDVLNKIYNSFDTWFCLTCSLPPFSDSFFDSSISSINDSIANNSLVTDNNDDPVWKILNQHSVSLEALTLTVWVTSSVRWWNG